MNYFAALAITTGTIGLMVGVCLALWLLAKLCNRLNNEWLFTIVGGSGIIFIVTTAVWVCVNGITIARGMR